VTTNRFAMRLAATVLLSTCYLFVPSAKAEIRYIVSLAHPEQHLFHVTVEVPNVSDHVDLQMAAWDALYEIRDFSSHVQRVTASANGREVSIEKLDKLTLARSGHRHRQGFVRAIFGARLDVVFFVIVRRGSPHAREG